MRYRACEACAFYSVSLRLACRLPQCVGTGSCSPFERWVGQLIYPQWARCAGQGDARAHQKAASRWPSWRRDDQNYRDDGWIMRKRNGVSPAFCMSINHFVLSLLSSGSTMEVGVYGLLLKITFAMTRAIARTDSRKPIRAIADQTLISIFSWALWAAQWSFARLFRRCNGMR